jgi:hypothetical protein
MTKTFCELSLEQGTFFASGLQQIAPFASGLSSDEANGEGGKNKDIIAQEIGLQAAAS